MIFSFLRYPTFGQWLVHKFLEQNVVNWGIGLFLTYIVLRLVLSPMVKRLRAEKDALFHHQAKIEDLLDPETPGGLGDVMAALGQAKTDNIQE